mgnify:CR=1 FL=1
MQQFKHTEVLFASILKGDGFKLAKMNISDRIRQAIEHSGQSKSAIAKRCQVSPSAVTQWLSGETKAPKAEKLLKLARATGVSYTWLVEGKGLMHGRPKDELEFHETEIVEDDAPLAPDEIEIPFFREVEMAAGDGRTQVIENHGQYMKFSLARLARAGVQPHNAACATLTGTSMEPVILDGSPIGIDKGTTHIVDGQIYALDHGGMLRVKRLYRAPLNRMRVVSDNQIEYPEETYSISDPDAPKIIGRVFWWEVFA